MTESAKSLGRKGQLYLAIIAIFGFLERIALRLTYAPYIAGDTEGAYMRLAEALRGLTLAQYDATRVPGYPLLLLALDKDPVRVWLVQMAVGWLVALLLFWFAWRTTQNRTLAFILGMLYHLIPAQFLFEANILTETFTAFFLVLSFVLLREVEELGRSWSIFLLSFLLGLVACLPGMMRPLLFPLTVWLLFFVLLVVPGGWRRKLFAGLLFSIPPLFIQGGWLLWVYRGYHMLSPTTLSGYSLVQHTGAYFELLPDDEALIRDTYLRFRDARLAERGVQTNTIWHAIPALTEATGMHFFELSRKMGALSRQLIRQYPGLYLRTVMKGWIDFWKAPVYWDPSLVSSPVVRMMLSGAALAGRGCCLLANGLFLLGGVLSVFSKRVRAILHVDRYIIATGGFVLLMSVVQTLADHGDNPRFLVPLQMLVFYVVLRAGWSLLQHWFNEEQA